MQSPYFWRKQRRHLSPTYPPKFSGGFSDRFMPWDLCWSNAVIALRCPPRSPASPRFRKGASRRNSLTKNKKNWNVRQIWEIIRWFYHVLSCFVHLPLLFQGETHIYCFNFSDHRYGNLKMGHEGLIFFSDPRRRDNRPWHKLPYPWLLESRVHPLAWQYLWLGKLMKTAVSHGESESSENSTGCKM